MGPWRAYKLCRQVCVITLLLIVHQHYSIPSSKFLLGLAHEWGCIREMKWCPSGTHDPPKTTVPVRVFNLI